MQESQLSPDPALALVGFRFCYFLPGLILFIFDQGSVSRCSGWRASSWEEADSANPSLNLNEHATELSASL